jgi:hypothetical protein
MLTLTFGTLLLVASPSDPTTAQLTTVAQEPLDEEGTLPKAAVFFLPRSSALSPVAADIVARAAQSTGSGTIVLIQASSDKEAGETPGTVADRADVVRRELIRDGVPPSAIRTMHAGAFRTGIESRRVIVSVIPAPSNIPPVATGETVPAGSRL